MKIKDKIDLNRGDCRVSHAVHHGEKTPRFWLDTNVMNSICIYLRANDSYIYMYRREKIYKEPPEEIQ
jgi:hypothetical protein